MEGIFYNLHFNIISQIFIFKAHQYNVKDHKKPTSVKIKGNIL